MARNRHAIYVGWDSQQPLAYDVCRHSLMRHASSPPEVVPLHQQELRERTLYWRKEDPLASTEFTYTRFLVPHLARYEGWALFMDSDFLVTADIGDLFAQADERYALLCVQHDYRPSESVKMDGAVQTSYPRKNWSSLVLWNCGHPANRVVTPEIVNRETGSFLHRFQWLDDALIGALPGTWNWLEGWNEMPATGAPNGIHFTRGGPWYENWGDVAYADLWREEQAMLRRSEQSAQTVQAATWTETASHGSR
jgi:hypothetical protein